MIVQDYYPEDVRVRREASASITKGYQVDIICIKKKDQKLNEIHEKVRIFRVPLRKNRGNKFRYILEYSLFFFYSFIFLTLLNTFRRYNLIHVNTLPDILVFTTIIPKLFGSKVLLDMHEIMPEFFMSKFNRNENSRMIDLLKYFERISIKFAHRVITVNQRIADIMQNRTGIENSIEVVMNSVDENIFKTVKLQPHDGFILSYHGTLTEVYGVDEAIRAVSILKEKIPDIKFRIFGSGVYVNELEKEAGSLGVVENIQFMGRIPFEKMPSELAKVDVGILPFKKDQLTRLSCSNKLNEYIIMGIPVVITKLEGTLDYFNTESLGFISDNDPNNIAQMVYKIYEDKSAAEKMVKYATDAYYDIRWDVMKKRYLEVVKSLIGRP